MANVNDLQRNPLLDALVRPATSNFSFTHRRKEYRICAIRLTAPMTLHSEPEQHGETGDYFCYDEEGAQFFRTAEEITRDFDVIGQLRINPHSNIIPNEMIHGT